MLWGIYFGDCGSKTVTLVGGNWSGSTGKSVAGAFDVKGDW